jgi:hypothetical protein
MLPWVSCNLEMVTGLGKYSSQPKRIGRDYKARLLVHLPVFSYG